VRSFHLVATGTITKRAHRINSRMPTVEQPFKAAMTAFVPAFREDARKNAVMAGMNACSTVDA
jgi:hypothetical protein